MAAVISAKNITIMVAALSLAAVAGVYLAQHNLQAPSTQVSMCTPPPENIVSIGPARTIAEVERLSIAEMATAPDTVPRVPFGHQNSEWVSLKASAQPGDTVHEFRTEVSGGHMILRGECLVGQLAGWIR